MAQSRQDALIQAGFEHVHSELDWYDGPRAGLADVGGVAHYFRAIHDYHHPGEPDDVYYIWPASQAAAALEHEQWTIFTDWNTRYEAGAAAHGTHPAHAGTHARYDELTALLASHRATPATARRLKAEWQHLDSPERYSPNGPDYLVRWRPDDDPTAGRQPRTRSTRGKSRRGCPAEPGTGREARH